MPTLQSPHLQHFTSEPFADAAAALRRVAPKVLGALLERLREVVPDLMAVSRPQLENGLPDVMEQLAAVMEDGIEAVDELDRETAEHAEHREGQDINLDEMLLEYQMLRELIVSLLAADLRRDLSAEESIRLHAALDLSARRAAQKFAGQQRAKMHSETASMAKYLAFLSHDLRGNLNGAMLMIEVLRRDLQGETRFAESVNDLDAMRQSMLELVGTMDRFLHAERLRQGRVEVSLQTVEVGDFLKDQKRAMARQVRASEKQIEVEAAAGLRVVTDREMLGLIVQNTLSNCVKYAGGGPVRLHATALPHDGTPSSAVCRIEVSDTGPGMDGELQKRLFEPFVRGLDTGRPGTGLGLYIAKHAADLLGARLAVESEPGVGTTFIVELPNFTFPADTAKGPGARRSE